MAPHSHLTPLTGISLRNFGIQVPIYATLSDIVVYAPKGLTRSAFALAERFKHAVEAKYHERASLYPSHPPPVIYNVFIVTDNFATFERNHPDLIGISSTGRPINHVYFPEREMQEMQDLTRATEIHPGVFLGNSADVPIWERGDPEAPFDSSTNPDGYDICVECHDQAQFPSPQLLKQAEDHLAALDALWATGYGAGGGAGGLALFSSATTAAPPRPPPNANTIIHFSFPAAPQGTPQTIAHLSPFISFLQSVLHRPRRCKILIYSHDGYTESSILALSLLMAEKRCSLPEAYLEMQVGRGRSFFVHQWDLGVLRRIEARYAREKGEEGRRREAEKAGREKWGWGALSLMGRQGSSSSQQQQQNAQQQQQNGQQQYGAQPPQIMPIPTLALSSSIPNMPSVAAEQQLQQQQTQTLQPTRRARSQTSPLLPALVDHHSWFNDDRFDGSFPSRVLPFLYLGNLYVVKYLILASSFY